MRYWGLGMVLCMLLGCQGSRGAEDDTTLSSVDTQSDTAAPDCQLNVDCLDLLEDLGPCEVAVCLPGELRCVTQVVQEGTLCDDNNACTRGESCVAGECLMGELISCDDANPCTTDSCDAELGCSSTNLEGSPCDDGDVCTRNDTCSSGACIPGDNICPCQQDTDCLAFEDGNACNGTLRCNTLEVPFVCEVDPDTPVVCDPSNNTPCQVNTCDPGSGLCSLQNLPEGTACNDGSACTEGDTCRSGTCVDALTIACDDGNPCTDDTCYDGVGCTYVGNGSCGTCSGLSCRTCAFGLTGCAASGPFVQGTCCAVGDNLVHLAQGRAAEAVDIEVDDRFAYLCGGFGVRINTITNPAAPVFAASAAQRCQRIGLGPRLAPNARIFYLAHHGDTWVPSPFLATYRIEDDGTVTELDSIQDPSILFEGLDYALGHLFVATHSGGLHVYSVDPATGIPTPVTQLAGFDNAWKVKVAGNVAYVADGGGGGLKVVDVSTPTSPILVQSLTTTGLARDVEVHGNRVFVAMGGDGIDIFDATTPTQLRFLNTLQTGGSVQAVSAEDGLLAVANWSHLALYDIATETLLGTEELLAYPDFEQVLGVSLRDGIAYAAEWEQLHVVQYREGYVAPDISIAEEFLAFIHDQPSAASVIIRNRGQLDLVIDDITFDPILDGILDVGPTTLRIPPDGAGVVEVTFVPQAAGTRLNTVIEIHNNDPDSVQNPFQLHVHAGDTTGLDVGDSITQDFAFLDPGGLQGLEGNVVVLAYFALF